jgi:L-lactate utilization protein LutB
MKATTPLKDYVKLRDEIFAEREQLISRLREIDETIGSAALRGSNSFYYGQRTPTGRARNGKSLKQVVLEVLADKSMTKHEILDAVLRAGYQFSTDDPLNSLGVILYGKSPKFKNEGGKFTLPK